MLARVLCALFALASVAEQPVPETCFVRVERGRARLVHGEETLGLAPALRARETQAGDRLEVGAGSAVELAWRARSSALVEGPATLLLARSGALVLERFGCAELEVRRGTLAVRLPGCRLELGPGAVQLAWIGERCVELYHRGGEPLVWRNLGEGGVARAGRLRTGERIRLVSAALPRVP